MQFQFQSFSDFFAMAGHGPYVWACYAVTSVALIYLVLTPLRRRRQLLHDVRRQQRLTQNSTRKDVQQPS